MSGYSGVPLAAKLGIKEGSRVFLVNAPKEYRKLVAPLPPGARFVAGPASGADMVHVFSRERWRLDGVLRALRPELRQDVAIWVSWPKKASKVPTDITEDTVRQIALPLGLVDTKVCAVDDVWSGLKLVIRRALRAADGPIEASTGRAGLQRRRT